MRTIAFTLWVTLGFAASVRRLNAGSRHIVKAIRQVNAVAQEGASTSEEAPAAGAEQMQAMEGARLRVDAVRSGVAAAIGTRAFPPAAFTGQEA